MEVIPTLQGEAHYRWIKENVIMYVVEKNVPLPATSRPTKAFKYPLKQMALGDSFLITLPKDRNKCRPLHSYAPHGTAKKLGIKLTTRKVDDNSIRVWRVA
jgi:hypothetical protein